MMEWNGYEIPWKIVGNYCYAQRIQQHECDNIARWINDPQVNRFLFQGWRPVTIEEIWHHVESDKNSFQFSIFDKESRTHIGWGGVYDVTWMPAIGEIRLFIGDTKFWGRGIATDMEKMMMVFAFDVLNIRRLMTGVNIDNTNVVKLVERCKYIKEGIYRSHIYRDNRYYDAHMYALLRSDFEKVRDYISKGISY